MIKHHNIIGYAGDPFDQRRGCEIEPCSTGPCGTNAECSSNGRTAICKVDKNLSCLDYLEYY